MCVRAHLDVSQRHLVSMTGETTTDWGWWVQTNGEGGMRCEGVSNPAPDGGQTVGTQAYDTDTDADADTDRWTAM